MYISDLFYSVSHERVVSLHGFPQISRHSWSELHSLLNNWKFVSAVVHQYHFYGGSKLITKAVVASP